MLDKMSLLFRYQVICEEGSIRKAAERLNVAQPALSRSLKLLEDTYSEALVERHARGVRPTMFGNRLLALVARLSRDWELGELALPTGSSAYGGVLRISSGPLWTASILPVVANQLQKQFPDLGLELSFHTGENLLRNLSQGKTDIALGGFQLTEVMASDLEWREFTTVHDRVIARSNHPIHKSKPDDYSALHKYPWIVFTSSDVYRAQTQHAIIERTGMAPNVRIYSNSMLSVVRLLQEGDYLCMLPVEAVASIAGSNLSVAPIEMGRVAAHSGALFRKQLTSLEPVEVLLQLCQAFFQKFDQDQ